MTSTRRTLLGVASALVLATASLTAAAHADDPPAHRVKYTVTAAQPARADIYYLDTEPPEFFRWSHDPYQYVPNIKADVGPGKSWVFELMLTNPEQWALVTASTGRWYHQPAPPNFHCDLTVDGVVVASKDGPKGVRCSLRNW